jgi:hypothetical protein
LLVAEQAPQVPEGWHAGAPPPHSPSFVHARQVCVVPSQKGTPPAQSADATHPTHVPVVNWQMEVGPEHWDWFVAEHSAQAPDGWQAGEPPPHSPSPEHARHACVVRSQMGDAPPHWPEPRQPTHTPLTALQTGVAPEHAAAFVAEHAAHAPFGWQAGVPPPQSASAVHARHVCVVVLHVGVVPPQVAFATQATHVADVASHAGVAPVHRDAFVAEQIPHAPLP